MRYSVMNNQFDISKLHLYHYYDKNRGPLKSISCLDSNEAEQLLNQFRKNDSFFAGKRDDQYMEIRSGIEKRLREKFVSLGGKPIRQFPHYFTLGKADWLKSWYPEPCYIKLRLSEIDPRFISFTYGDTFPAFRYKHNNPTKGQVFTIDNIGNVINQYGLPQKVNPDGKKGPIRYIEAQLWCSINMEKL